MAITKAAMAIRVATATRTECRLTQICMGCIPRTNRYIIFSSNEVLSVVLTSLQGEIVHLGGGSVPAMLYALSQGQNTGAEEQQQLQEFLGKSVLPMFGLDNESATYPFVDLWGLPHGSLQRARELAKALPGDSQMLSLFASYRDLGYIIFPGIADVAKLETDLAEFLVHRSSHQNLDDGVSEQMIYGKSFYWLGMMFAVLASGAQCSALTRKERELTSQVYGQYTAAIENRRLLTLFPVQCAAASSACDLQTFSHSLMWRAYKRSSL